MDNPQWFKMYVSILVFLHAMMVLLIKNNSNPEDEAQQLTVDVVIIFLIAYIPLYYKGLTV